MRKLIVGLITGLFILSACSATKSLSEHVSLNSGANGQGMRFLLLKVDAKGLDAGELQEANINGVLLPFEKIGADQYESFLILEERADVEGENGKSLHPVYGILLGKEEVLLTLNFSEVGKLKGRVKVGKIVVEGRIGG